VVTKEGKKYCSFKCYRNDPETKKKLYEAVKRYRVKNAGC
jgi:hypothetical protein